MTKTIPKKKKCKKAKWFSEKKSTKGKGKKERHTHLNAEFQRIAGRDKKAFLSDQCKDLYSGNLIYTYADDLEVFVLFFISLISLLGFIFLYPNTSWTPVFSLICPT